MRVSYQFIHFNNNDFISLTSGIIYPDCLREWTGQTWWIVNVPLDMADNWRLNKQSRTKAIKIHFVSVLYQAENGHRLFTKGTAETYYSGTNTSSITILGFRFEKNPHHQIPGTIITHFNNYKTTPGGNLHSTSVTGGH